MSKINILNKEYASTDERTVLFNASGSPDGIINDLSGSEIVIKHIVNEIRVDEKTGEQFNRCVVVTDTDKYYVVSSEAFITRLEDLFNTFGEPSENNLLGIKVRKQKSSSSDNSYLTFDLI